MNSAEREPTSDELLAMAYADGELDPDARTAFEARMRSDAALAREVAAQQRLHQLARHVAGPEPMDAEWERIARASGYRASLGIGASLLTLGALSLGVWAAYALVTSSLALVPKLALGALIAGLFVLTVRAWLARRRTRPYDPYTEVRR
ncbi:MAG: hypothetical protein ACKVWV_12875 [Planctomycetota bacterium]